ncbi:MAG TPA: hypothetical protein VNT75_00255 [Symbiobacteriaceae bacterium]|nr:hypothetical protein [Symbiobacteriaceae bacterium]
MKALLGILLMAHGLVHIPLPLAPGADGKVGTWLMDPARNWPLKALGAGGETMKLASLTLVTLTALTFLIAGLSYFGFLVPAAWFRITLAAAAVISLVWLVLFWHPWLVVGLALDVACLLAVILDWTPATR